MGLLGIPLILLSPPALCLCAILLVGLIAFLNKTLRKPLLLQRQFNSGGIRGPPYQFIYGNALEIRRLTTESMAKPMSSLSHDICGRLVPHVSAWTEKYGRNFVFWLGPEPTLIVLEPELVKLMLNDKERVYSKAEPTEYLRKLLGDGLVTSRGEKWAKMRKLANHAFQAESLKNMIPAMIASTEIMLERWNNHEGEEIEVFGEFKLLTSEVISRTAFGSSYLQGKLIFEMLTELAILVAKNTFIIRLPVLSKIYRTRDEIEAEKLKRGVRDLIIAMVRKRENMVTSGELDSYGGDFLGLLLKAHHEVDESKKISVDDLVDECKTFYIGGQETTNMLLTWAVLLLSMHTEWQEQARKEVVTHFGSQTPDPDGISKLKNMSMIINETLRLYPPVLAMMRKTDKEVRLGNFTIPSNTNIRVPNLPLHHDPEIWGEDVHLFKPERFSEGIAKATNSVPSAYIPFGMGPRVCAGFNFAAVEAKIALSMILQRYSFTLSPAYIHSPTSTLTLHPQHGVQIVLHAL
ncbi:unnamed protein product [Linum tenue]|uniref:Cytochrome P450 n=1 Tax=Linum tenue TaxID=586396 RepID=A0AAV0HZP8_9ROSI|nr:unnamed protein product [Linum tenue]